MSDEAVKALREWCAIPEHTRVDVASWMGEGPYMEEPGVALRLLAAAPALLARLEAGEARAEKAERERDELKSALKRCCICPSCADHYKTVTGEVHNQEAIDRAKEQLAALQRLMQERNDAVRVANERRARIATLEADLAQHRAWHSENVNQIAADGARIKALEARLAEVGPVVEAAEFWVAEYASVNGDVSAVWWTTHRKLAAAVAARARREAPPGAKTEACA